MLEEDLLYYYEQIRKRLPPTKLKDMNLEEELLLQLHTMRVLQQAVLEDEEVPANQKTGILKTVADTLNRLAELQNEIYSSERFKRIETVLIRALLRLPEETSKAFLDDYEAILSGKGAK
jgi:hypothetical protein